MKNLIFIMILALTFTSCSEDSDSVKGAKKKKGGGAKSSIEDIINEVASDGDLDLIADIIDEEANFSYSLEEIVLADSQSIANIGLNQKRGDGGQNVLLYQQRKVSGVLFEPLELIRHNLDNQIESRLNTGITEQFYALRASVNDDIYYLVTRFPIKIYKIDFQTSSVSFIAELFTDSSLDLNKRVLNRIHHYQNSVCGLHNASVANLFHKNGSENISSWSANGTVANLYCLNEGLIELNDLGEYFWHNSSGSQFVFSAANNSCTEVKVSYRQDGFYFLCYYLDAANKKKYHAHLVDEGSGALIQQPLGASVNNTLPYIVKLDRINSNKGAEEIVLHYRDRNETSWDSIRVETQSTPKKILTMSLNQGELQLMSTFALYQLKENSDLIKIPMAAHPKHSFIANNYNYIVNHLGGITLFDPLVDTNDYYYNLTQNAQIEEVNPAPFISVVDKLSILRADVNANRVNYFSKVAGNIFKAYQHNLDTESVIEHSFSAGDVVLDMISGQNYTVAVLRKSDGKHYLHIYDENLGYVNGIELTSANAKNSKINIVSDGIVLSARKELVKYNFNLEQIWSRPISGVVGERIIELANGRYIGLFNGFIVLVNPTHSTFFEIYSVTGLGFTVVKELMLDEQRNLYMNYQGDRVLKLKLPYSVVNFED